MFLCYSLTRQIHLILYREKITGFVHLKQWSRLPHFSIEFFGIRLEDLILPKELLLLLLLLLTLYSNKLDLVVHKSQINRLFTPFRKIIIIKHI